MFRRRAHVALVAQAVVFVAFHWRTFSQIPNTPVAMLTGALLFLGGFGWGWQVQRDRTVAWAMVHHSLLLAIMSMFEWG